MDKAQKAKKNMLVKLLAYLHIVTNAAIYAALLPMVNLVKKINDDNETWNGLITKEAAETTGITTDQDNAKLLMAEEWGMVAKGAYSYFLFIKDNTNAASCNISDADIMHLGNSDAAAACDNLMLVIGPHIAALIAYGITAAELIIADGLITTFEGFLGLAKAGEGVKSSAGTAIKTIIKEVIDPELIQLDAQVDSLFFKNQKDFKEGYFAVRALDSLPTIHTALIVQFYIAGTTTAIIGATIKEMVSGKSAIANNIGIAALIKFKGGKNLMFEASHPQYVTQQIVQTVMRGKKVSIIIKLVPVPVV